MIRKLLYVLMVGSLSALPFALHADSPADRTTNKNSDQFVCVRIHDKNGIVEKPVTFKYHINDIATQTELLAPVTITNPPASPICFTLPRASMILIIPGRCSVSNATVCTLNTDCPGGEVCQAVPDEAHMLSLDYTFSDGGGGTWAQPFRVLNNPFVPF